MRPRGNHYWQLLPILPERKRASRRVGKASLPYRRSEPGKRLPHPPSTTQCTMSLEDYYSRMATTDSARQSLCDESIAASPGAVV